ncbi:RNA polymerase sigma-70 factor, ECF subfamily [bacterium A37T11]|nr:RNA polymerase sigma-70 factor, ECF subfamily [bacterium A37T11]
MPANFNEKELNKLIQGEHKAFNTLYILYKPHALRFAIHILHNEEEAEDIVHDLFAKIWEGRNKIKSNFNFKSFLFTCLRNIIIDHIKHKKRHQSVINNYDIEVLPDNEPIEDKEYRYNNVRLAVKALTSKRKDIVCQCLVYGKSYQEVAALNSISKNTVKNQLVKAKKLIRDQLTYTNEHQNCPFM